MDHDLGIETGGNEFHPAALRLYEPYAEANPRDRVLRQDLTPTGADNAPTHHPDTQEAVAELHVKPELHGVSSINNHLMRACGINNAIPLKQTTYGVHRNTYKFCGKPIGCVAKNRCARKT